MTYSKRVRENLLPKSVNGTLPKAFEEWYFTHNTIDHEIPTEDCGLCDKEELRYHFEIANSYTLHTLWVGSSCIVKFMEHGLKFREYAGGSGRLLNAIEAKKHLNNLKKKMHLDACIKALERLASLERSTILKGALDYYLKNKRFTPKQASVVFWRFSVNGVDFQPSLFNIAMQRENYKRDLKNMDERDIKRIEPAMTSAQRRTVEKIRNRGQIDNGLIDDDI